MRWMVLFLAACAGPASGLASDADTAMPPAGPETIEDFADAFTAQYVDLCEAAEPDCFAVPSYSCAEAAEERLRDIVLPYCVYNAEAAEACLDPEGWFCNESNNVVGLAGPCGAVICGG